MPQKSTTLTLEKCQPATEGKHLVETCFSLPAEIADELRSNEQSLIILLDGEEVARKKLGPENSLRLALTIPLKVDEYRELRVDFTLMGHDTVSTSVTFPSVDALASQFLDQVASGRPVVEGQVLRTPPGNFVIEKSIKVVRGGLFQMDAGAFLSFAPGTGIVSRGRVFAYGRPDKPVYLNGQDGEEWAGIVLSGLHAAGSTFSHTSFSGGGGRPVELDRGFLREVDSGELNMGGSVLVTNMGHQNSDPVHFQSVSFHNNHAICGGALAVHNAGIRLTACTFEENHADQSGGALFVQRGSVVFGPEVSFKDNKASQLGGATSAVHGSKLTGVQPRFVLNQAPKGSDLYVLNSEHPWENSTFDIFAPRLRS